MYQEDPFLVLQKKEALSAFLGESVAEFYGFFVVHPKEERIYEVLTDEEAQCWKEKM